MTPHLRRGTRPGAGPGRGRAARPLGEEPGDRPCGLGRAGARLPRRGDARWPDSRAARYVGVGVGPAVGPWLETAAADTGGCSVQVDSGSDVRRAPWKWFSRSTAVRPARWRRPAILCRAEVRRMGQVRRRTDAIDADVAAAVGRGLAAHGPWHGSGNGPASRPTGKAARCGRRCAANRRWPFGTRPRSRPANCRPCTTTAGC